MPPSCKHWPSVYLIKAIHESFIHAVISVMSSVGMGLGIIEFVAHLQSKQYPAYFCLNMLWAWSFSTECIYRWMLFDFSFDCLFDVQYCVIVLCLVLFSCFYELISFLKCIMDYHTISIDSLPVTRRAHWSVTCCFHHLQKDLLAFQGLLSIGCVSEHAVYISYSVFIMDTKGKLCSTPIIRYYLLSHVARESFLWTDILIKCTRKPWIINM